MEKERTVILEGVEIAHACWHHAEKHNKIPKEILKDKKSYVGIMLVEMPNVDEDVSGTFENIRFAVKRAEA